MERATRVLVKRNRPQVIRMETARKETVAQNRRNARMRCAVPQITNTALGDLVGTGGRHTEPRGRHLGGKPAEAHPRDRMALRATNKNHVFVSWERSFAALAGRRPLVKELVSALVIANHMSNESIPIGAVRRYGVALVREPPANPLHEVRKTNPTTGIHVDLEACIATRALMAEKGTEPGTETFNERILSPSAGIMTIPWAEVETDSQGLMGQIDPRNGVILHARWGRG